MFTTKHHSAFGIASVLIAFFSLSGSLLAIWACFMNRGDGDRELGAMGFFAVFAGLCGLLLGILSNRESDIHRWVPVTGIAANAVVLASWAALIMIGG